MKEDKCEIKYKDFFDNTRDNLFNCHKRENTHNNFDDCHKKDSLCKGFESVNIFVYSNFSLAKNN